MNKIAEFFSIAYAVAKGQLDEDPAHVDRCAKQRADFYLAAVSGLVVGAIHSIGLKRTQGIHGQLDLLSSSIANRLDQFEGDIRQDW